MPKLKDKRPDGRRICRVMRKKDGVILLNARLRPHVGRWFYVGGSYHACNEDEWVYEQLREK